MTGKRTAPEGAEVTRRSTPSSREHELAMAMATKQTGGTSPVTESGVATTGPLAGQVVLKSHVTVRAETEDWPQYIGRYETELRDILDANARLTAELPAFTPSKPKAA